MNDAGGINSPCPRRKRLSEASSVRDDQEQVMDVTGFSFLDTKTFWNEQTGILKIFLDQGSYIEQQTQSVLTNKYVVNKLQCAGMCLQPRSRLLANTC